MLIEVCYYVKKVLKVLFASIEAVKFCNNFFQPTLIVIFNGLNYLDLVKQITGNIRFTYILHSH